jgi:hypothetical protein
MQLWIAAAIQLGCANGWMRRLEYANVFLLRLFVLRPLISDL